MVTPDSLRFVPKNINELTDSHTIVDVGKKTNETIQIIGTIGVIALAIIVVLVIVLIIMKKRNK